MYANASVMFPAGQGDDALRFRRKPRHWELDFSRYEQGRNLSPRTIKTYLWCLHVIIEATGKDVWELKPPDLLAFMESSPYPPRTTAQIVAAAKQGHRWAAVRGLCEMNGVMAVSPPKIPKSKPKGPVSLTTARSLLEAARTPLEIRVTYLGLYAGTRVSESAAMTAEHDKGDRLRFFGKGNAERDVPIHPELRERLPVIFSSGPTTLPTMTVTMRRLRDRVGALTTMGAPATAHALRRTCGQTMYEGGAAWEVADTMLGHLLPGAGERYLAIPWSRLVSAVALIDYYAGAATQMALW